MLSVQSIFAQKLGYVELSGGVKKNNKNLAGAQIEVFKENQKVSSYTTANNGKFETNLDLNSHYTIVFSGPGLISKSISFNTRVPDILKNVIFEYKFNVDLYDDVGGLAEADVFNKPVAKIAYNDEYEDFDYDEQYTKTVKTVIDSAKTVAEIQAKQEAEEKARQEAIALVAAQEQARKEADERARLEAEAKAKREVVEGQLQRQEAGERGQ